MTAALLMSVFHQRWMNRYFVMTEEEENIPNGPPRTRNEIDESYDLFDPNELDLTGAFSQ